MTTSGAGVCQVGYKTLPPPTTSALGRDSVTLTSASSGLYPSLSLSYRFCDLIDDTGVGVTVMDPSLCDYLFPISWGG